jgi:hypothetical protein
LEPTVVSLSLNKKLFAPAETIEDIEGQELQTAVENWFLSNFEDPANETPYNGREGGYQYIWGGPYDAREQIEGYFGDSIPQDVIDKAVSNLESDAVDWAPHSNRIYDEDPPDYEDPPDNDYVNLQRSLDELETALSTVETVSSSIGGNNPPVEIGVPPYTNEDKAEIKGAIEVLRQTEPALFAKQVEVVEAVEKIKSHAEKLADFLKKHGGQFADAFSTQLGKSTATAIVGLGAWQVLEGKLFAVYHAVKVLLGLS